jgi:uncharacterized repeat protein (TIGR01451 family)
MQVDSIRTRIRVLFTLATLVALTTTAFSQQKSQDITKATAKPSINPMELPLTFEPNQNVVDGRVRFLSRGSGYTLFLTPEEAVLSLSKVRKEDRPAGESTGIIRLKLEGANPKVDIKAEGQFAGKNNYYIGNDPKNWRTGVPTFARVRYSSVYPGIDMVYYGNQRRLEHDFIVAPGADPKRIRVAVDGALPRIDSNGDLLLTFTGDAGGAVRMLKPVVYQQLNGKRREIEGSYKLLAGSKVAFELGKYDKRHELIIDPVLAYSTYYGGNSNDIGYAVATSSSGIVYFSGTTASTDFPTANAAQPTCSGCGQNLNDAFVVGIDPASGVIFSTYLGGSGYEEARGIAVSNANNIYVAGFTNSTNFPTASGGLPTVNHGGTYDGFVTQLNASGALVLSGFLGGLGEDQILGVAFDNANNHLLLTGYSTSNDFPYNPVGAGNVAPLSSQLYQTLDGAGSWAPSGGSPGTSIAGMDVQSFLITPGSTDYYAGGTSGVWHSTDGQTWAPFNSGLAGRKVTCLVYVPSAPAQPYACTDQGLYQYNPSLTQWIGAGSGLPTTVTNVFIDPNNSSIRYAGSPGNGVFVSSDGGASWSQFNTGITATPTYANSFVADSSGNIYVGIQGTGTTDPVFYLRSGNTWVNTGNAGLPVGKGLYANSLTYDIRNGRIYAGIEGNGVWYTTDSGASWTQTGTEFLNGPSANVTQIALDAILESTIYAGTDNGIYKSVDSGSTWFRSDSGVFASTVRAMVVDKSASIINGDTTMYVGYLTQQGFAVSLDTSYSYILSTMFGGDGTAIVDPFFVSLYSPAITGSTAGHAIASDPSGNIYVAGQTSSSASYVPGHAAGAQPALAGDHDGVLMKFDSAGNIVWGTYLGGSGFESANGVAADANSVYVGGVTFSGADFPVTAGVFQPTCSAGCGYGEGFVARYNPAGAKQWATYIGGSGRDSVLSVAVDGTGEPVMAGQSEGAYFPQANPLGPYPGPFIHNPFVSILNTNGSALVFSSLFGGSNSTYGFFGGGVANGVAVASGNAVWLTGYTVTSDFPIVAGAPQNTFAGAYDSFLTGITTTANSRDIQLSVTPDTSTPSAGQSVTFNISITNASSTGAAANVRFTSDLAFTDLAPSVGTCTPSPAICNFGDIAANATVLVTATYTYPSPGNYQNFFSIGTDDNDPNPANNQYVYNATVSTGVSDVGISISAPPIIGREILFDYLVNVTNNGPSGTSSFDFTFTFDPNTLPAGSIPPECVLNGQVATCTVSGLNANQNATFDFPVVSPTSVSSITALASVNVAGDPNASNNNASAATSIGNTSDLQITSSVNNTVILGAPVTIDLQYYNNGPDDATNVVLTIPLPSGVTFNSATGLTCSGVGTITCNIGGLPYDNFMNASISVTVNQAGTFTITGTLQGSEYDSDLSNSKFSSSLTVSASAYAREEYLVSDPATGSINLYSAGTPNPGSPNTLPAGSAPYVSAIDHSGRYGFVSSSGFTAYTSVIDFTIGKEVARIHGAVGRPMVITPDGSQLILRSASIAPGANVDHLAIVNTSTFQIVKTISLDGLLGDQIGVNDISIFSGVATNNKVYLQVGFLNTANPVYTTLVVNLSTNTVAQVTGAAALGSNASAAGQRTIALSADGTKVYALRNTPSTMLVINTSTDTVTQSLDLTPFINARSIVVTQDPNDPVGQFAYIVGRRGSPNANIISSVDLKTLTLSAQQVTLTFVPNIAVLSSDGTYLHAFQSGLPTGPNNAVYVDTDTVRNGLDNTNEYRLNNDIGAVSMGFIVDFPADFSPQIAYLSPPSITDTSVPTTINILGSNFTPGANVKLGNQDPQSATFVSTGRLDVTVPAGMPEQDADVVVTLPNSQELPTGRNISAGSYQKLIVNTPFQLNDPLIILNYGNSKVELVPTNKNGQSAPTIPNPVAVQVTPDGSVAYVSNGVMVPNGGNSESYIQAISLSSFSEVARITVLNDLPGYQDGFVVSTDPVDGKPVLYYLAVDDINATPPSDQLYVVDLDPASPNYHQVKRTIRSPFNDYNQSVNVVASPDGRYVYVTYEMLSAGNSTRLEQFDTLNGTVTGISTLESLFNVEFFPNHMRITTDGNWILLPGADGSVKAFDVSSRSLAGLTAVTISDSGRMFKNFQVVGNRLFAFDAINNYVTVFNFLPAGPNFTKLGQFQLSGPGSQYVGAMRVDPTGSFVYADLMDQDTLVVLDANKVAASNSSAVIAKGNAGSGVFDLQIAPAIPQQQVDLGISLVGSTVAQGAQFVLGGTLINNSPVSAQGVVATLNIPAGIDIASATFYFNSPPYRSDLCTIALPTVTCNLGTVNDGENVGFYIQSTPTQSSNTFNIQATATSIQPDANPLDNNATTTVTVVPGADAFVTANFPVGGVQVGQPVSFTFTVDNAGSAIATSLQGSMFGSLQNMQLNGVNCTLPTVCNFNVGDLAPNAPTVYTVTGTVPSQVSPLTFEVVLNSATLDPNQNNNSVTSAPINITSAGVKTPTFLLANTALGKVQLFDPFGSGFGTEVSAGVFPRQVLVMPNGRTAFLINNDAAYISVIDLSIRQEIFRIRGIAAAGGALTSDGTTLIVSDRITNDLVVIDTTSFGIIRRVANSDISFNLLVVGSKVYFVNANPAAVGILDIPSGTLSAVPGTQIFSRAPGHLALTTDGTTLVAVGGGNAAVAAEFLRIDVGTNSLVQNLPLPINTTNLSLAVTPVVGTSEYAYVSMDNTLQAVDVKAGSPTIGQFVSGINRDLGLFATSSGISKDGNTLVFVQQGGNLQGNNVAFTDAPNITDSQIISQPASGSVSSATAAQVDLLASTTAPQITAISPTGVLNDTPSTIEIDGVNFSSDAVVKIGSADPIAPVFVDSTKLMVTLPAFTPSGSQSVIVINRNQSLPLDQRNEAGAFVDQSLEVVDGIAYSGQWDTFVADFGDTTYTTTNFTSSSINDSGVGNPWGIAASQGGVFFFTSQSDNAVVSSLASEGVQSIPVAGQVGYGDAIAIVPDVQTGRVVALAPSSVAVGANLDWQLNVVDADPYSPTRNLVIRTIRANSGGATANPNGFAATPDGKYAFGFFNATDNSGRLAVYNLTNDSATVLTATSLGVDSFVQDMRVSNDSKYLAIANAFTNTIKIFDITNPTSPVARGTITPTIPNGTIPSCCNMRFNGSLIYVFDPGTMQLQVFNFQPTLPDFSPVGLITVPGSPDPVWQGGLAVSPDGAFVYVAQYSDDSMAVFNAAKVGASDPSALITRIKTGRAPVSVDINPVPTFSTTADLSVIVTHTPEPVVQGTDVIFNVAVTNAGPFASGPVAFVDNLPAGMKLTAVTVPSQVTCVGIGTATAQCNLGSGMQSGASYNFSLTASTTNANGSLQNVGVVTSPGSTIPDPNSANNTSIDAVTVGNADLAITLVADIPIAGINGTVNYTATIINNGSAAATGVTASLNLDNGAFFTSSAECSVDSSAFCNIGTLNGGQSVSVHLVGQMPSSPGVVTAFASASENETDANPTDNSTSLPLNVVDTDLTITITANPPVAVINNLVTFTATITNNSPATATNAFAILSVDQGNLISSPECSLDGSAYCTIGTVAPGQTVSLHAVAQMPNTPGTVTMTGDLTENETDSNPADNTATLPVTVGGGADLALAAAAAPTIIGGVPTYTVTVTNNGPDLAPNVVVTDELTRFQFVSAVSSVGACAYDGIKVSCPIGNLANGASATVNVSVVPPNSGWASSEFHATSDTLDPNGNNNIANLGPTGGSVGNTRAGFNVLVDALDTASGMPASFTFANVTKPGLTSVQSSAAPQPPAGYRFGQPARLYELTTTASYAAAIQVTLQFAGTVFHHPGQVRMFHLENGAWVDRTSGLDATRGVVTGVTASLSPFILVEPLNNAPVANAGSDSVTPGSSSNGNQVNLNGAASVDADGDGLSYRWTGSFPEGNGSVTGVTPTVTLPIGSSPITLVVNDGETDSAPVTVSAIVSDFLLAAPTTQVALRRGQSASFDVAITPKFGAFNAAVALACSNLPSGVSCSVSNPSVTPGGQGVTATVTLTASVSAGLHTTTAPVFAFWLGGFPVFGLLMTGSLRPRNWRGWLLLAILLVVLAGMVACGGGGGIGNTASNNPSTTPANTSTITLTGTSGGLQHTATATIVIQ